MNPEKPVEPVTKQLRNRTISVEQRESKKKGSKPNPFIALKDTVEEASTSQEQNLNSSDNESENNVSQNDSQISNSEAETSVIQVPQNNTVSPIIIKVEAASSEETDDDDSDVGGTVENPNNLEAEVEQNDIPEELIEQIDNPQEIMAENAISITDLVEVIPKVSDEKTLEHFISIVDNLTTQVPAAQMPIFLIVIKSRIIGKAFQAIKGKVLDDWNAIKTTLQTHLDVKIDYSTALNRLTRIKQERDDTLKCFIEKIRDALAVLNKVTAKDIPEGSRPQVILINDATAKNTFEAGLGNHSLKTVTIAAQKTSFVDSYSFATNQEQTNFPNRVETDKKDGFKPKVENKSGYCFKCNQTGHRAYNCFKPNSPPRQNNSPPTFNRNNSYNGPNPYKNYDNNNRFNNSPNTNQNFRNDNNYQRNAPASQGFNRNNQNGFAPRPNNGWNDYNNQNRQSRPNNGPPRNQNGQTENRNANIRTIREAEEDWDAISPLEVTETGN